MMSNLENAGVPNPGDDGEAERWSLFARLAALLAQVAHVRVLLVGTSSAAEQARVRRPPGGSIS
jgi:hypothetical protein